MTRLNLLLPSLMVALLLVCRTELRKGRIPDAVPGALMGLAVLAAQIYRPTAHLMLAVAAAEGWAVTRLVRSATAGGLGQGDVKLIVALAMVLGPVWTPVGLLAAALAASLGALLGWLIDGECASCEAGLPFGPYLVGGAMVALVMESTYE